MLRHDEPRAFAFGRVRRIFDALVMRDRLASADEEGTIGRLPPLGQMLDQLSVVEDAERDLCHNRARHFDPRPGRWLDHDPLGFHAGEEGLYRYPDSGSLPPASDGNP